MEPAASDLPLTAMLMGLGGGLALFLYGMRIMTQGLALAAGDGIKRLLERATSNRFSAAGAGTLVTAVLQSSSVVTVLLVGFIGAGLLTAPRAVGVIIGANVGTTITAQIVAFKVTAAALALIAAGFLLEMLARRQRLKQIGVTVLGLGLIFLGMNLMSDAMAPLRDHPPFLALMADLRNPFAGLGVGALFTALVQSSSVTTGIVIVLAGQGLIDLRAGIALVLGANVGTCVTALLAAVGRPREALRIAVIHVAFNLLGALAWLGLVGPLAGLVTWMSPDPGDGSALPRQVANAHTAFNLINALVFIWFTGPLAALAARLVPERAHERAAAAAGQPQHLDDYFLAQPDLALDRVREECARLGGASLAMVRESLEVCLDGSEADLAELERRDRAVDDLHEAIVAYLGRLAVHDLLEHQTAKLHAALTVANYLEQVGDVVESVLVPLGRDRLAQGLGISAETRSHLAELHTHVCTAGADTVHALAQADRERAEAVAAGKQVGRDLAERARRRVGERLQAQRERSLAIFRWETDLIEAYDRLHTLYRRIARLMAAEATESGSRAD